MHGHGDVALVDWRFARDGLETPAGPDSPVPTKEARFRPGGLTAESVPMALPSAGAERCRETWNQFRATFPDVVRAALDERNWPLAIGLAIHSGQRDETELTDLVFLSMHGPDRGYCRLRKTETDYIDVWKQIRRDWVRPRLALPSPPIPQRQGIACVAREVRRATPKPDKPGVDITGRYEVQISGAPSSALPVATMQINQAGRHIEVVYSPVLAPGDRTTKRPAYRRHGDLQADGSFTLFDRAEPDWWGKLRQDTKAGRLFVQASHLARGRASGIAERVSAGPVLTESAFRALWQSTAPPAGSELERSQWFPLTRLQLRNLNERLQPQRIAPLLDNYFRQPSGDRVQGRMARLAAADRLDAFVRGALTQGAYGVHKDDIPLARFYARLVLSRGRWAFDTRPLRSQLDWIHIALCEVVRFGYPERLTWIRDGLGLSERGCTDTSTTDAPHKYDVTVRLIGGTVGVAGYGGTITIEKTTEPRWQETYDIRFLGFGIFDLTVFPDSLEGKASSHIEWKREDVPGWVRLAIGDVKAGGVFEAEAGFMHIEGPGYLPTMHVIFPPNVGVEIQPDVLAYDPKEPIDPPNLRGMWGRISSKAFPKWDYSTSQVNTDHALTYGLTEDVHFCLDSALLTEDARHALRIMCANELPALMSPSSHLSIVGHADRSYPPEFRRLPREDRDRRAHEYNLTLSDLRAKNTYQAIQDVLGQKLRIPDSQVSTRGQGEALAAAYGLKPGEINADYRRVDVVLNARLILTLKGE
jgi:outer membrane protein OmpA-like peptidoglycan-associated protein